MRPRVAFSTNAYTAGGCEAPEAVERIAAAGYRGIELLADWPHLYPHREDHSECLRRTKDALQRHGMRVVNINANTASGYESRREGPPGQTFGPSFAGAPGDYPELAGGPARWREDYTQRCIDLAVEVGCPDVCVASGFPSKMADPGDLWRQARDAYARVCEYAQSRGVRVNIEYEPDMLVGSVEDTRRMTEEVGASNLGINLDLGHSFCLGEDVCDVIRRLSHRIHTVHVEDLAGPTPELHLDPGHLIPGDGVMPLRAMFEALSQAKYGGWLIVELYTYARPGRDPDYAARESLRRLDALMAGF